MLHHGDVIYFLAALVMGGASDEMNVAKKPQPILLSDSDSDECEKYQPPKSKLVDVSIEMNV